MTSRSSIYAVGISYGNPSVDESYAVLNSPELLAADGSPAPGGLYDARLGVIDHMRTCHTCGRTGSAGRENRGACPGHRGVVKLAAPYVVPMHLVDATRWLRIVCHNCGLLQVKPDMSIPRGRRLAAAAASGGAEGVICERCGVLHAEVAPSKLDRCSIVVRIIEKTRTEYRDLMPHEILAIFERVADSDVTAYGKYHPREMVSWVLPTTPTYMRPNLRNFGGTNLSAHEHTDSYKKIIRCSNAIAETGLGPVSGLGSVSVTTSSLASIAVPTSATSQEERKNNPIYRTYNRYLSMMQLIYALQVGESAGSTRRTVYSGDIIMMSLMRSLMKKKGLIRENILGQRCVGISRSTIVGCTRLHLKQVEIPICFATSMLVAECVNPSNIEWLTSLCQMPKGEWPGADCVRRPVGPDAYIEYAAEKFLQSMQLTPGDVVLRHAVDGDLAYFNRQPTLEQSSITVFNVVVSRDPSVLTINMNVDICKFFNADFDGDAMNLWIVRGGPARAEAAIMSSIHRNLISAKNAAIITGQVLDSVLGASGLTRGDTLISRKHAMRLLGSFAGDLSMLKLTSTFTSGTDNGPEQLILLGRDLVSALFMNTPFDMVTTPGIYKDSLEKFIKYDKYDREKVVIKGGRLISGVLDSKSVGAQMSSVHHRIAITYGSRVALDSIYNLQHLTLRYAGTRGYTVCLADLFGADLTKLQTLTAEARVAAKVVSDELQRGEIVAPLGKTVQYAYEMRQKAALESDESSIYDAIFHDKFDIHTNSYYTMVSTGSNGNIQNLIYNTGIIGQTLINEKRIGDTLSLGRSCMYFPRFDTDPSARGFVAGNYVRGLTGPEFLMQMMKGRYDIITKALSTASTGAFERTSIMCLQSVLVTYLHTLSQHGRTIAYLYGDDGAATRELAEAEFPTVEMTAEQIAKAYSNNPTNYTSDLDAVYADVEKYVRASIRIAYASGTRYNLRAKRLCAVNVRAIVESKVATNNKSIDNSLDNSLDNKMRIVREAIVQLPNVYSNNTKFPPHIAAVFLVAMQLRWELRPSVLENMSAALVSEICRAVHHRYQSALIDAGNAVGLHASQALGEPLTQYMLNSHHRVKGAGTSTSSLDRINDIFMARGAACTKMKRVESMATTRVITKQSDQMSKGIAEDIASSLEHLTVGRFVASSALILEPRVATTGYPLSPYYAADAEWRAEHRRTHPLSESHSDAYWCMRVEIDRMTMLLKKMRMDELAAAMVTATNTSSASDVEYGNEARPEPLYARVWLRPTQSTEVHATAAKQELLSTTVRGIPFLYAGEPETKNRDEKKVATGFPKLDALLAEHANSEAIQVTGSNLEALFMTHDPRIDVYRTVSTSIDDVRRMFGIVAAERHIIYMGLDLVPDANPRHFSVYAASMTYTGIVTSISRNGQVRGVESDNFMLIAAHGAPIKALESAARNKMSSAIDGFAPAQMVGAIPKSGTAFSRLVIDEKFVQENLKTKTSSIDDALNGI